VPEFGGLPVTFISAPVSTLLPPDDVIIENTEISGSDVFEEVVDLDSATAMRDPMKEQVLSIVQGFGAAMQA
jgi:hypothetical protein